MSNQDPGRGSGIEETLATFFSALFTASQKISLRTLKDASLRDDSGGTRTASVNYSVTEKMIGLLSTSGLTGPIVPVPRHLIELTKIANRIVSFVLDDAVHFGTGMLVGPSCVLTAAHLFFDKGGRLIDRSRLCRITVEVHTTEYGNNIMEAAPRVAKLDMQTCNSWLVDPGIRNDVAQRDVDEYDFAIVRLDKPLGRDDVGKEPRGWFPIPTVETAEVLVTDLGVRVFQYLDRKELLTSSGHVRGVVDRGFRVLHTASTASSASGAAIVSDRDELVAMHVAGAASNERPKSNRGLPIRRIAEIIDQPSADGETVRKKLEK